MSYNSKYTGAEVDEALGKAFTALQEHQDISGKQDVISDLADIRSGASKGSTALQSIPSEYITETELANKGYATTSSVNTGLSSKVDKVSGKGLSTEDFTTALKTKLEGLSNYDDTALSNSITSLQNQFNALVNADADAAIDTFNEIVAFLAGLENTETLEGIIASIEQQITGKQDAISDLATIRSGAAKGATALQSVPSEYVTETELTGKGYATTSQLNSGLEGKMDKVTLAAVATSGSYNDLTNKPTIPAAVTVDSALSSTSTNPVQNKVINTALSGKQATISDLGTIRTGAGKGATAVQPSDLSAVATSGSYNDLSNKPTIPSALSALSDDASHRTVTDTEKATWNAKSDFSGSYNDLSNKPTIPTVNNATLTIQKNGTSVGTFTANASSDKSINITVPTTTSELTNNSGFLTSIPSEYVTESELTSKGYASTLSFTNLSASSWVSDSTYAAYPYRCDLTCSGVTANDYAEVVYGLNEAISGNYAPICSTSTNVVSIWSTLNETITIPTIKIIR